MGNHHRRSRRPDACGVPMTRAFMLLLLVASGCAATPEPHALLLSPVPNDSPAAEQSIFDHARQTRREWRAQGNPELSVACAEDLDNLAIVYMPRATIGACAEEHGCLFGTTILVDDAVKGTGRANAVVEHHLRHWFAACSMGDPDAAHALDNVWYDDARDES